MVAPGKVNALLMRAAEGEITSENAYADTFGQMVTNLLSDRLERGLRLLRGIPWFFLRGMKSENDMKMVFKAILMSM